MDKNEYINKVLQHISNKAFVATIKDELENHIADREEYYTEIGYDTQTAAQKAIEHMGNADTVGEEMNLLHDYKKHKIICIIGLIVFVLSLLLLKTAGYLFNWIIYNKLTAPILCISIILTYIIYKYAFVSRSRIILFLQGTVSLCVSIYFTDTFNFTWISNITADDILDFSILISIVGIVLVVHSIICFTCSSEIRALIKGKPNNIMLNRYETYRQFFFVFMIIFILIIIALSVYSAIKI